MGTKSFEADRMNRFGVIVHVFTLAMLAILCVWFVTEVVLKIADRWVQFLMLVMVVFGALIVFPIFINTFMEDWREIARAWEDIKRRLKR
jgi:cell division protein FtsW (lipid II flippase)